jgi:hypothetical protein
LKSLVEQTTKTGQLFRGSKFAGVARTATAFGGTTFPPCAANDFSCALNGTLPFTVEPEENATPAKLRSADFEVETEAMLRARITEENKSEVFWGARASRVLATPKALASRELFFSFLMADGQH